MRSAHLTQASSAGNSALLRPDLPGDSPHCTAWQGLTALRPVSLPAQHACEPLLPRALLVWRHPCATKCSATAVDHNPNVAGAGHFIQNNRPGINRGNSRASADGKATPIFSNDMRKARSSQSQSTRRMRQRHVSSGYNAEAGTTHRNAMARRTDTTHGRKSPDAATWSQNARWESGWRFAKNLCLRLRVNNDIELNAKQPHDPAAPASSTSKRPEARRAADELDGSLDDLTCFQLPAVPAKIGRSIGTANAVHVTPAAAANPEPSAIVFGQVACIQDLRGICCHIANVSVPSTATCRATWQPLQPDNSLGPDRHGRRQEED
jgi:hypothetical protein